jgi:protein involved in polysaccharide export with SLBB domain
MVEAYKLRLAEERPEYERERELRARAAGGESREGRLMAETRPVTAASETIRTGDVLAVEISGESDLPRAYVVQEDGAVRLPILGAIKVAGLTAQQAGQAITKQVSRVNPAAKVHVALRRPRTDERRQR